MHIYTILCFIGSEIYLRNFLFYYKCKALCIYNLQFDSSIVLQKMDQFDGVTLELEDCGE